MSDNRKNIKLQPDVYDKLDSIKPEEMSWAWFFLNAAEVWEREKSDVDWDEMVES